MLRRLCAEALDRGDYLLTLARLSVLDWLVPRPETPADRAIREQGERLRKAFPTIDFDHPGRVRRGLTALGADDPNVPSTRRSLRCAGVGRRSARLARHRRTRHESRPGGDRAAFISAVLSSL